MVPIIYHIRFLFNTSTGTVSNHIYVDAGVAMVLLLMLLLSVTVVVNFGVDVALMAM